MNGETAYLVRGGWSANAIEKLSILNLVELATYTPDWDYDTYLSLFFNYKLPSGETVEVMIRAGLFSYEWITTAELVDIAESIQSID